MRLHKTRPAGTQFFLSFHVSYIDVILFSTISWAFAVFDNSCMCEFMFWLQWNI